MLRKIFIAPLLPLFLTLSPNAFSQSEKELIKLEQSVDVVEALSELPEKGIPPALLSKAEGLVIIPKLIKAGFVVGGRHGKGIALIRKNSGAWSNPLFVKLTGGSLGFQIGAQSIDLVLIFKDSKTLEKLASGKFTLGGDVSIAAGPVGRQASAATDLEMEAEVYSYSRTRGLFAGISLDGSSLNVNRKGNREYYGEYRSVRQIFEEAPTKTSPEVKKLHELLSKVEQ